MEPGQIKVNRDAPAGNKNNRRRRGSPASGSLGVKRERWLSAPELLDYLGITPSALAELAAVIPSTNAPGVGPRFLADDVDRYLLAHGAAAGRATAEQAAWAPPAFLSITQVARLLGVSKPTVRRLVGSGAMAVVRVGRQIRVRQDELWRYIERHTSCSAEERAFAARGSVRIARPDPLTDDEAEGREHARRLRLL